jgi:hypothetical protein
MDLNGHKQGSNNDEIEGMVDDDNDSSNDKIAEARKV